MYPSNQGRRQPFWQRHTGQWFAVECFHECQLHLVYIAQVSKRSVEMQMYAWIAAYCRDMCVFIYLVVDGSDSGITVEAGLQRALSVLWLNPAVPLYRDVCGALAVHLYNSQSTEAAWNVAFYLSEGHAPTLRHSSCLNTVRKMRWDC